MSGNLQSGSKSPKLDSIEAAIADIKAGKVVIVVDDEQRENEGDFICAAACITPEIINFMATHGRGLICTPIDEQRADELKLDMMVPNNTALHETAFTVSIDLIGHGCTTGISAHDRAACIRALVDANMQADDFARPGHIFPLRAKTGGVLRRTGHTEAAIDLARLAGFKPAGVLVEILNEDGSMARLPQLFAIGERHGLKIISIKDLIAYRMRNERIIRRESSSLISAKRYGELRLTAYTQLTTGDTHLAIQKGDWKPDEPVLVRVHSATEDRGILGLLFDDYSRQLHQAMDKIVEAEQGLLLYMCHEEKSNALLDSLQYYQTQQSKAHHSSESQFGQHTPATSQEQRDYGVGAQILRDIGISKMRLISNQPRRRVGLIGYGLEVVENIALDD